MGAWTTFRRTSGLMLSGRRVIVAGGGHRRPAPRACPAGRAGAVVTVVSLTVTPAIEGLVGAGEVTWLERGFEEPDLDGARYVIAATDDPDANEHVSHTRPRSGGSSAYARTTPPGRPPGRRPSAGTRASPCSPRQPRAAPLGSGARRDPRGLREGHDRRPPPARLQGAGVVLVGGGLGDPDLMSVAGRKALMEADVALPWTGWRPGSLLSEPRPTSSWSTWLPAADARPSRRRSTGSSSSARWPVLVVRFKGGDNFVFGRGYEEVLACREAGVPVTVIPGLTSPVAVPAVAGIPVTIVASRTSSPWCPDTCRSGPRVARELGLGRRHGRHRRTRWRCRTHRPSPAR